MKQEIGKDDITPNPTIDLGLKTFFLINIDLIIVNKILKKIHKILEKRFFWRLNF